MNIAEIKQRYSVHSDSQSHIICELIDRLERAEAGLRQIDDMRNATQIRGRIFDIGTPEHFIDDDGFIPMPFDVKTGLTHAANMARETLEAGR